MLSYERLEKLRQSHAAIKLLNADLAPLVISFLYQSFLKNNRRSVPFAQLVTELDDYLFILRERLGEDKFSRKASQYLNDWSSENLGYLRKYYVAHHDEPECDLTPEVEKVFEWLQGIEQKEFVGTESRLLMLFQLLRDVVYYTNEDINTRIAALEKKKQQIEQELAQVKSGVVNSYDGREIKERFLQAEEIAKKLLGDFRQVEHNFRKLDRETREYIATSDQHKGAILETIFNEQDLIRNSDQGKSFRAFWEFLMSPLRQDELATLLVHVYQLEDVQQLSPSEFLKYIQVALLEAGGKVYGTASALSEQLRKFLDNRAYLENKRLMQLIQGIEKKAIDLKEKLFVEKAVAMLPAVKPEVYLLHARTLFNVPQKIELQSDAIERGYADDLDLSQLYQANYIDINELKNNIRQALQTQPQISLSQLLNQFPLQKGMAELVHYVKIASDNKTNIIAEHETETVLFYNKRYTLPKIIFCR